MTRALEPQEGGAGRREARADRAEGGAGRPGAGAQTEANNWILGRFLALFTSVSRRHPSRLRRHPFPPRSHPSPPRSHPSRLRSHPSPPRNDASRTRLASGLLLLMVGVFAVVGLAATTGAGRAQIPPLPGLTTTTARPATTQPPPTTQPPATTPPTEAPTVAPPTEVPTTPPTEAPTVPPQAPETFPAPAIAPQQQVPLPVPRPPVTLRAEPQVPPTPQQQARRRIAFATGLPSGTVVAGSYGMGVASVFLVAFLLIALSALARAQRSRFVVSTGGTTMDRIRTNNRLPIGFACLGLAVVVAILGYLGLSRNPDVNRQIPYLASAGMAVVILAAIGGSFIVAEQLRNDDKRIAELEDAVRLLAGAVGPALEAPARVATRTGRTAQPAAAVYEPEPSADETEIIETVPAARAQRVAKRVTKDRR